MEGLSEYQEQRIEEWVSRMEAAAAKQAVAAEGMCEAANRIGDAVDEFGNHVANLEATFRRKREYPA